MTSIYDETSTDALADIAEAGAPVVFLADAWKGGTIAADVTGSMVEIPGDPDVYQSLGLIESNPVTGIVAAWNLGITPSFGTQFRWAGTVYTTKLATPVAPDGTPIIWTIVGVA
jgi:uroporphyrinogen-III decarboxylase